MDENKKRNLKDWEKKINQQIKNTNKKEKQLTKQTQKR